MKKLISILLLLVFLFNAVGFYGLFLVLRYRFNSEFTEKLDSEEYSGNGTMIIKVPCPFPYQVNFDGYERVDGEFQSDGEFYKLVKQKRVNDTLFVVLIRDNEQDKLHKSLADFIHTNHDEPLTKSTSKLIEHFEKNFVPSINPAQVSSRGWCRKSSFGILKQFYVHFNPDLLSPPPELASIVQADII